MDSMYYHIVPPEVSPTAQNTLNFDNYTDPDDLPPKNDSLLFDTFVSLLIEVSTEQLKNVKSNIMNTYDLHRSDVADVKMAFKDIEDKYTDIITTKLKTMLDGKPINITDHFMIDFMDVSNYILEKVLRYHIKNVKGKIESPTKWYRETLKEKILRQQTKIAFNYVENSVCETLQVCRDRYYYSDYLADWLRTLMNVTPRDLKRFFIPITDVLERHKYFIKSNIKFRQTIKYIINADAIVKRDTLDFLDEILTNPDKVLKSVPHGLKPSVTLLRELFSIIDGVYDVNDQNIEQLENITEMLRDWIEGNSFDVHKVLNAIVDNIRVNLQIWPLDIQNKIYYVWSEILVL
ncbi:hypothetical protein HW555_002361 [Spodoptera exigua]|uniref:Uncharacterized protein n=1 Tax=Spodoptera exigua TaxID=7107 RepID=A0A835GNS1_SPOEX|nr:hypothetical protein HW555_002361 [Spodoptera exigua]